MQKPLKDRSVGWLDGSKTMKIEYFQEVLGKPIAVLGVSCKGAEYSDERTAPGEQKCLKYYRNPLITTLPHSLVSVYILTQARDHLYLTA